MAGPRCACGKTLRPCPSRNFPRHMNHCEGWIHNDGTHGDKHTAAPVQDPKTPAVAPHPAGQAAASARDAAAEPGTAGLAPVARKTVPGTPSSRPGRAAPDAAPGTGTTGLRGEDWAAEVRKTEAKLHKAQRNRRGKWKPKGSNPFGKASGVRIPPPGGVR